MSGDIVSTDWLAARLDAPDIAIIDASWHLPTTARDARAEFRAAHIRGAQFFDIDDISDTASPLPHMLPAPAKFAARVKMLGIGDGKRVIAYDSVGLFSAARAWWMFKVFGHDDVAVLDGGLKKWIAEGRPVAEGAARPVQARHFTPRPRTFMVKDMRAVAAALQSGAAKVADARSGTRYRGEEVEPRPGVRAGHMPGARNVHYASLLNPDGTLKPPADIAAVFQAAGIDLAKPVITSCGSGVTAAILALGLTLAGARGHALYDGSWAEWGADPSVPVATGP
jgi:thiosulfate/3-mercaptopyruvate sulfurtransferase